jgi:DNA-binding response OmpR family regulator
MAQQRIVLIEDDPIIADMYGFKLEHDGYALYRASDGETGLHLIEKHDPDIALIDLRLPGMNGDKVIEQIRQEEWGQRCRIIVLTNISRDEAPGILRLLRVDRYIVKAHHTPQQVVDIVREVLR